MAPELDNFWFERSGWCYGAKPTTWQGRLLAALYSVVVIGSAYLLVDRSILAFVAVAVLASAVFLVIARAKTSDGPGRGGARC